MTVILKTVREKHPVCLVILLLVIPVLMISPVAAHPPSAINLTYTSSTSELAVTITHAVRDPADHYIDVVEVRSVGAILILANYTSQPTAGTFTYQYTVPAKSGDLLEVNASCNKGGSLTETVLVPAGGTAAAQSGIPPILLLHMGLITAGFVCIATSALYRTVSRGSGHRGSGRTNYSLILVLRLLSPVSGLRCTWSEPQEGLISGAFTGSIGGGFGPCPRHCADDGNRAGVREA